MSLLMLSPANNYYVYHGIFDFRNGINGMCQIIRGELIRNPLTGDVFIFFNRHRNQVKIIQFEGDGFGFYQKRLERGTYEQLLAAAGQKDALIDWQTLVFILQGVVVQSVRFHKRYHHGNDAA